MIYSKQLTAMLVVITLAGSGTAVATEYEIDPGHTSIHFSVDHFKFAKVQGRFNNISGRFTFDPAKPQDSKVFVVVDVGSIDTNHQARDDHMRDPTFFHVARFPNAVFRSNKVTVTGPKTGLVAGKLTILGVTIPVILDVTFNQLGAHPLGGQFEKYRGLMVAGFSAKTSIRRSSFGMTTDPHGKGDVADLTIEVEGWSRPAAN